MDAASFWEFWHLLRGWCRYLASKSRIINQCSLHLTRVTEQLLEVICLMAWRSSEIICPTSDMPAVQHSVRDESHTLWTTRGYRSWLKHSRIQKWARVMPLSPEGLDWSLQRDQTSSQEQHETQDETKPVRIIFTWSTASDLPCYNPLSDLLELGSPLSKD